MKREMFICTFVYNKINFRDERRLGLILSFMFRQLEREFCVSLPCSAVSSVSELLGWSVVWWGLSIKSDGMACLVLIYALFIRVKN